MTGLIFGWGLDFFKYKDEKNIYFNQSDVDELQISEFLKNSNHRYQPFFNQINNSINKKSIYASVSQFPSVLDGEEYIPVHFICEVILPSCAQEATKELKKPRTLISFLMEEFISLPALRVVYFRKKFLLDPKNWDKLKESLNDFRY